jgi:hypothetical protein
LRNIFPDLPDDSVLNLSLKNSFLSSFPRSSPRSSTPSVCINENPSEGQVVVSNLTHITSDLNNAIDDVSLWQKHSYEIINQKQSFDSYNRGRFEINNETGAIIVTEAGSKSLDYELVVGGTVENVYEILVRVTDDGDPILGDVATITIQLSDVNEPPTFNKGTGRFEVDEVRIGSPTY